MENLYGRSVIPPEQIIGKLREVDVLVGREATEVEACRHIGGVSALPRASDCADRRWAAAHGAVVGARLHAAAGPPHPLRQAHQVLNRCQSSRLSAPVPPLPASHHPQGAVACTFSSLAEPATPVRTSSPNSSRPATRSPPWPGPTRLRQRRPRSAPTCVVGILPTSMGSRRRLRSPTASSTSGIGLNCSRPVGSPP